MVRSGKLFLRLGTLVTVMVILIGIKPQDVQAQEKSVARLWNEALLEAIRMDYARPTVHARNLFHTSVAMYDSWAIIDSVAQPYLIGNQVNGFMSIFDGFEANTEDVESASAEAISYAAYRVMSHRFWTSPGYAVSMEIFENLMDSLGYDPSFTSIDYSTGQPAALGNFVGNTLIDFGFQDGAREQSGYDNASYRPVNDPLITASRGNPFLDDPNRWQPLALEVFIDQGGHLITGSTPEFLSPEWGSVAPFALEEDDARSERRDGYTYKIYHDPGTPPQLSLQSTPEQNEEYHWGFSLVSMWGSHLDPTDGVIWDISPASLGNVDRADFPDEFSDFPDFYKTFDGGDIGEGRLLNPVTGQPYEPQMVPRGDYARVLAEFWADGPDSETPPGHWFVLLNYVNDHPQFEKRFRGEGPILNDLEWDVKAYFLMAGTMHDAAIAAWSIKGWHDYIRPVSAIRYMAELGQCTDESKSNFHPAGIPLVEGLVEIVGPEDTLAGNLGRNVGKIKLYTWKGHDFIEDPEVDQAGVDWILAEDWMPYQRPSFVTPPFAGFVSGHSTYSRAAAELMTMLSGDAYFPGGMGEFVAKENEFLVFEEGPSQDIILQWATYRDASDQCSLSRIWGGIHPPADDIPGRIIGEQIGKDAFQFGVKYFEGAATTTPPVEDNLVFPNPVISGGSLTISESPADQVFTMYDATGKMIDLPSQYFSPYQNSTVVNLPEIPAGVYVLRGGEKSYRIVVL